MQSPISSVNSGIPEQQLLQICSEDDIETIPGRYYDWTPELYGSGKHLRIYGYYPRNWKLYVHTSHGGPTQMDIPTPHDLNFKAPIALYYNPRIVKEFKKRSRKECHVLMAPMVFYRRHNNITRLPDAVGTLAFAAHTTTLIDDVSDINLYIDQLLQLPEKFHPISVMLHPTDVNKGLYKHFLNRGIPIYSAGNSRDYRFAERFYDVMRRFKYTTSNQQMSCLFYSVEMGIPHFLYGNKPQYVNRGDVNIPQGDYNPAKLFKQVRKMDLLFEGIQDNITPEQKEIVEEELGIHHGISRVKCAYVLYKALILYKLRYFGSNTLSFLKTSRNTMRQLAKKLLYKFNYSLPERFVKYDKDEMALLKHGVVTKDELAKLHTGDYTSSILWGKEIKISDSYWHLHSLKEIFVEEVYKFNPGRPDPYILDCGANIGLSVIYFKRQHPGARIVAFEPDPAICETLKSNVAQFDNSNIEVKNKGLWNEETVLTFNASGGLGGRIEANAQTDEKAALKNIIRIETVRLKDYLNEKVDFLKIDIEGAEFEVLKDCADKLHNVERLFVEYHGWPDKEQNIDEFLAILKNAGFRVYIRTASESLPFPFLRENYSPYYDLKLNIFCYRV